MSSTLSPLELLRKFLREQPQDKINSIIDEVESRKYEGSTIQEYFIHFTYEFENFYDNVFASVNEEDYQCLWDSLSTNISEDVLPIVRKPIVDVVSKEKQSFNVLTSNNFALAA